MRWSSNRFNRFGRRANNLTAMQNFSMSCKATQELWLERPGSKVRAAKESAEYEVHLAAERCKTKGASGPAGKYTILFRKGNDDLCYLIGLLIEKTTVSVIGLHSILEVLRVILLFWMCMSQLMITVMTIQEDFLHVKKILCIITAQQTFSKQWLIMTVYTKLIMTTGKE